MKHEKGKFAVKGMRYETGVPEIRINQVPVHSARAEKSRSRAMDFREHMQVLVSSIQF